MSRDKEPTERLFYEAVDGFFSEEEVRTAEEDMEVRHYLGLILESDLVMGKPLMEKNCRAEAAETLERFYDYAPEHSRALVVHVEEKMRRAYQA